MKSGASDPFADEDDSEPAEESPSTTEAESTSPGEMESDQSVQPTSTTEQLNRQDLPYKLRRERVKDERDNVHQLFVQDDTDTKAREAERELEDRLDEDVSRLDAREAIYLAGMQNLDAAIAELRTWGYDL